MAENPSDEIDIIDANDLDFPKVERPRIVDGRVYIVEYAVDAQGELPAKRMLDELKAGLLHRDPDHQEGEPWPDEAQPHDWAKLMTLIRHVAEQGIPPHGRAVNDLIDGIWEFKRGSKRVSFFDTPGDGTYSPKLRITDRALASNDDDYWWFPDFDDLIRLGHAFVKTDTRTSEPDLERCPRVREEDVAYDR